MNTLVIQLIERHNSRDPYKIASEIGIVVLVDNLSGLHGYYCKLEGVPIICINKNLPECERRFVAAHFLYHAITNDNAFVIWKNRKDRLSKYEKLGVSFAVRLFVLPHKTL